MSHNDKLGYLLFGGILPIVGFVIGLGFSNLQADTKNATFDKIS